MEYGKVTITREVSTSDVYKYWLRFVIHVGDRDTDQKRRIILDIPDDSFWSAIAKHGSPRGKDCRAVVEVFAS